MTDARAGAMVHVEGVTKRYGTTTYGEALSGIDITVAPGEVLGVIGPSGCGKTTLLHLVAGLLRPDAGRIELDPPTATVGYVFQSPRLLPWRSAIDNVAFAVEQRRGVDRTTARSVAERALARVGLDTHAAERPAALSGGMAQRVGLARALAVEPDVLLLDEPLGALDAITREILQEELARIVRAVGTTTLLVTHDIDEALLLADRVVVLSERPGRVKLVLDVPFGPPRTAASLVADPRYPELRRTVRERLVVRRR